MTNTFFPHIHIHQATWYPPDPSRAPSLKDYILVKPRLMASVLDTRVFRGADIDSDHRLVVMSIRLKLQQKCKEKWEDALMSNSCKRAPTRQTSSTPNRGREV